MTTSTWAAGDYPAMARHLVPVAEHVIAATGVVPGQTLLDVGCGTGNAALAAARLGAAVTGVDPTPELLALAADRADAERLEVTWKQASAHEVAGGYDRVVSVFGAMYAPDAARAAAAMAACCAPGGRIVSAAWTPDGFMSATNAVMSPYLPPPPPGADPPSRWGDPEGVRALFALPAVSQVTTTTESLRFEFRDPEDAARFWIRVAGHLQLERPRLVAEGRWDALHDDVAAVFAEWNRGASAGVSVEAAYTLATITIEKPGGSRRG